MKSWIRLTVWAPPSAERSIVVSHSRSWGSVMRWVRSCVRPMMGVRTSLNAWANEAAISPRAPIFWTRASCSVASASSSPSRIERSRSHSAQAPRATTTSARATITLVVSAELPPKIRPLDSLVGQQPVSRAFERDRPVFEHVRPLGQPESPQHVLLDHKDRHAFSVDLRHVLKHYSIIHSCEYKTASFQHEES